MYNSLHCTYCYRLASRKMDPSHKWGTRWWRINYMERQFWSRSSESTVFRQRQGKAWPRGYRICWLRSLNCWGLERPQTKLRLGLLIREKRNEKMALASYVMSPQNQKSCFLFVIMSWFVLFNVINKFFMGVLAKCLHSPFEDELILPFVIMYLHCKKFIIKSFSLLIFIWRSFMQKNIWIGDCLII